MPAKQYTPVGQSGSARGRTLRRVQDCGDGFGQGGDRPVEADELMVAGADPGPAEDATLS